MKPIRMNFINPNIFRDKIQNQSEEKSVDSRQPFRASYVRSVHLARNKKN